MGKLKKIMIDAGHYGDRNQSPVLPEYYESRRMWRLQEFLVPELRKYGFEVGCTRDDEEEDLEVTRRGRKAKGYDVFISLHSNAAPKNAEYVRRISVYRAYDNLNNANDLASMFALGIAKLMGVSKSYVKTRKSEKGDWEYYGVMRGARAVGCPLYFIIEHSFHTNRESAEWLMKDENLRRLAHLEAFILADYFGMIKDDVAGDVSGDGVLSMADYVMIKRYVLGTYELDPEQKEKADVNSDGKINAVDSSMVKRAVLGDYELPPKKKKADR